MMKLRILPCLIAVLAVLVLACGQARAEIRVALVIGNGDYPKVGFLPNPPNDARLMAGTLRQLGFEVIESIDANQKAMKRAISSFGVKLRNAGKDAVGLFYYAGHGVQVGSTNYLIPVKVDINSEADVDIEAVSANGVQAQMAYAGNRLNIIIMDACRNNPFKRGFRSASRGLAKMEATMGTLIAYATAPGDVAADGSAANSPYTQALSKAMLTPGLTVERVFKRVRNQVVAATNSQQVPWESSSLTGADFYFRGGAGATTAPQGAQIQPAPLIVDREALMWQSVQGSDNPALYRTYLSKYPNGEFAIIARVKMEELEQKAALSSNSPPPRKSPSSATPGGGQEAMVSPSSLAGAKDRETAIRIVRDTVVRANPAGGGKIIGRARANDVLPYKGQTSSSQGALWYKVEFAARRTGFIFGRFAKKVQVAIKKTLPAVAILPGSAPTSATVKGVRIIEVKKKNELHLRLTAPGKSSAKDTMIRKIQAQKNAIKRVRAALIERLSDAPFYLSKSEILDLFEKGEMVDLEYEDDGRNVTLTYEIVMTVHVSP